MAIPVLIIGKSGSGKSCSMRTLDPSKVGLVNVLGKPLPFKGKFTQMVSDDYGKIAAAIKGCKRPIVVIDDAGYLMTNMFMRGHAQNSTYSFYSDIGDKFWRLVRGIQDIEDNKRVYILMHEDDSVAGSVKPKTIGRMVDEKVCLEGMFAICLRCVVSNGQHVFRTQSDGCDVAKTPVGMFDSVEIENDLQIVDNAICAYYEIGGNSNEVTQ